MRRSVLLWFLYKIFGERVGDIIAGGILAALGVLAFFTALAQGNTYWWFGLFLILIGGIIIVRQIFWPTTGGKAKANQNAQPQHGMQYNQQQYPPQQQYGQAPQPHYGQPQYPPQPQYGQAPQSHYGQPQYPPQPQYPQHGQAPQPQYPPYGQAPQPQQYPPQQQPPQWGAYGPPQQNNPYGR